MLLHLASVLTKAQVAQARARIDAAQWVDGNVTSGAQSALSKHNEQLPENAPEAREVGQMILDALGRHPQFMSAALPLKVFPPLFNRYQGGQQFGNHIDNAVRQLRGTDFRIRTDLSATLFLAEPQDYDGGELSIEDSFGVQRVKLAAGDMVLYPASSLHHVTPVTRGARVSAFFWIQSMVRADADRATLYQLDQSVQQLAAERGQNDAAVVQLTGIYHNLIRRWAEL
ncbi:Fe2+-dependent dioxygenase [Bordetella pseudohinzii]|uniref:Fe2+-dependent dioxygenase n=1 Tax=Bordetella pseudohinzii TaxID=1331258 RepID=A0A0J6C0J8_9BORD|nr:Fe2+-dependent dioxygenase [Bordetella pseudohinzii]ANY15235.1 Fe2+-dependent dioxygenase [Bordetella pseudohinzii]KMM24306.1 Fe(II)-dependent oxygenase [Bordetella pseudohinzii]KXA77789.1 PKHD-type hydroxylase [Bordetella pseudohinzii]KXA79507.1 PKHD-type hydroxylase [Bordetella pseudohinzii]CUI49846.1 PKHD-type hydroxylase Sbal_3634 [Bordetella pseudohinzii]